MSAPPPDSLNDLLPDGILKMPVPTIRDGQTRMNDASACKRLVQQLMREDEMRSWRRAVAKGCLDRNPPYRMTPPGFSWTCNVNFGQLEGLMDSMRIPYWALFTGAPTYATFKTEFDRENPDSEKWNNIIAEEFTDMLNRWKQFRWHNKAKEFEMLFEGWGPLIFESPTDWRFTSIPARCIKVPKGAYSVIDDRLPFVVVMRDYRVHELWDKISDESAATAAGWNVPEVKWAIQYACNGNNAPGIGGVGAGSGRDWEYWQQQLKNADYAVSYSDADVIRCGMVFLKEYGKDGKPGRISVFIITIADDSRPDYKPGTDNAKNAFLYKQVGQYENYTEALNVYFQNTGDGTWHSVVGAGLKAVKHIDIENRLLCSLVDGAKLGSTPILETDSASSQDKMELMLLGPIARLSPGVKLSQNRIAQDLQGPLAVVRVLENSRAQNIGHYAQRSQGRDDGRGEQPTAEAVRQQAHKETALNQAQIDQYQDDLDTTYTEVWNRASKKPDEESRRMIDNCLKRGVPEEALERMCWVKANRLAGYPSPEMRKQQAREGMGMIGTLPQKGKQNMINEAICALYGPDKIAVFNPPMEQPDLDAALSQLENGAMEQGVQPIIVSGMNNATHLQIHLAFASETMEPLRAAMEEGGSIDPAALQEAFDYISVLGPHCQEHLDALAQDPSGKSLHQQFSAALKNVASFHSKLRNSIIESRKAAEQAVMEEQNAIALGAMDQAKMASLQADVERKNIKAASDIRVKTWKAQETQKLKTWQTGKNVQLTAAKTISDQEIKRRAAQNDKAA